MSDLNLESELMIQIIQSLLFEMSGGNPGAISVFHEIVSKYPNDLFDLIEKMRKHNIVGSHIWVLYKDHHKNIDEFVKYIQNLE